MDQHDAPGDAAGEPPMRILVVDDNVDITESLSILLEMLGHHAIVENDPHAALARLALEPRDVCLLDIGMPGMDGLELARRIRASGARPQPVLVAVTGFGEASARQAAFAAGFDRFLVKPLQVDALTALLEDIAASLPTPGGA